MDPATILILLGAFYAIKSGVKGVRLASAAASRASVPAASRASGKKPGGGMPAWFNRRRHTGMGWWAGEIRNGFPVFRAGTREGWTNHQTAMGQRQAAVAKQRADHTARQNTYRQERDAHRKRLEDIERQERERLAEINRTAAQQLAERADEIERQKRSGTAHGGSSGRPGVMAPPPSPGRGGQPAARPVTPPEYDLADSCSDPECTYCRTLDISSSNKANGNQPAGSTPAGTTTGGTMSDTSYQTTQDTCAKIQAALEAAMNDQELAAAEQLCDGLGPQIPDDTETLGHAGDLVTAIKDARAAMGQAIELAQAVKDSHEKNHGAAHEAALATGHMAEREHHMAD